MPGADGAKTIQFGSWELDLQSGLLTNSGVSVRLQPQPAKVLCVLARHAGSLVTRTELQRELWDGETFVDFDGGLNYCIRQIRSVLGDNADQPLFIETVPKRGYRFVAEVKASQAPPESDGFAQSAADASGANSAAPVIPRKSRSRYLAVLVLIICAVLAATWLLLSRTAASRGVPRVAGYSRLTDDGRVKGISGSFEPLVLAGNRILFTETAENQSLLAAVPLTGGEVSLLPAPSASAAILDYSAGSQELLFASASYWLRDQFLIATSLGDRAAHPVGNLTAHDAKWSPSGRYLAFAKGADIFVAGHDGSHPRKIATVTGNAYWLRWSPDESKIAFSERYGGYRARLWQVKPDGTGQHLLLPGANEKDQVCCGAWTENGRYFVYLSLELNRSDLWVIAVNTAGSKPARLTAGPLDFWSGPLPSFDNRRIFAVGEQSRGRLVRIDPATRKPAGFLGEISAEGVNFSPDGKWIAYTAFPEGSLWRSRVDGTDKLQLTARPMLARFPRWSPDGTTIAFLAATAGSAWEIYTVPAAGGTFHRVLNDRTDQGVPSWSPDGRSLAFGGLKNLVQPQKLTVRIVNMTNGSVSTVPGSDGLWTPRWSPDGRYFAAVTENNRTIRLFDSKTQTWSDLAEAGANDLVWSPDSQSIFFDENFGDKPAIYRLRIADRKIEMWSDLTGFRRAGFFTPWLGVAPDGSPILLSDVSIQEVYSLQLTLP